MGNIVLFPTRLIPTNGVYITRNYAPPGWYVARYDANGFTSANRWFRITQTRETEHACP